MEKEKSSTFCEEDHWKEDQSVCPVITWEGNRVPFAYQGKWQAISAMNEAGKWNETKSKENFIALENLYWL